jgi:hypothetical protein
VELVPGRLKAFEYAEPTEKEMMLMRIKSAIHAPRTYQR